MTLEEVLHLGEQAHSVLPPGILWTSVVGAVILCVTLYKLNESFEINDFTASQFVYALPLLLGVALLYGGLKNVDMRPQEERIAEWNETVLQPYMRNQPQQEAKVDKIKLIKHEDSVEGKDEKLPITVVYFDGEHYKTQTGTYPIVRSEDVEEPYITYTINKEKIYSIDPGNFITAIYLPKDYELSLNE